MPIAPNTSFDHYEIIAPLGKGGMGEVYRARDNRLNRAVAIKVLPGEVAHDAERLRRFEQEAMATSALNHPNILTVYDFGNYEGNLYLVMELLDGEELRAQLDEGALPIRKAIEYAQQIAAGLAAAHEKHIVHRDLKPENLFITKDNRVKILDFGLAKLRGLRNADFGMQNEEADSFEAGAPRALFDLAPARAIGGGSSYAVTAAGDRFLFVTTREEAASLQFTVVTNWAAEAKK
jgi:serine/threonine protein kinase